MDMSTEKRPRVDDYVINDINTLFEQFEAQTTTSPNDVETLKSLDVEVMNIKDCLEKKSKKRRVTLVEINQKLDKVLNIKDCLEKKNKKSATLNEIKQKLDTILEILAIHY